MNKLEEVAIYQDCAKLDAKHSRALRQHAPGFELEMERKLTLKAATRYQQEAAYFAKQARELMGME